MSALDAWDKEVQSKKRMGGGGGGQLWCKSIIFAHTKLKKMETYCRAEHSNNNNNIKACLKNIMKSSSYSCRLFSSSCFLLRLCQSCVLLANIGGSMHQNTCTVLQVSFRNLCLNLQRLKNEYWVIGGGGSWGYVMRQRTVSLDTKGNNAAEVQNTTLTKTWLFPERGRGGRGLIVSVNHVCCSSVFHIRPSPQCPPVDPFQFLIKFPRTTVILAPLSLSCIWIHCIKNHRVG